MPREETRTSENSIGHIIDRATGKAPKPTAGSLIDSLLSGGKMAMPMQGQLTPDQLAVNEELKGLGGRPNMHGGMDMPESFHGDLMSTFERHNMHRAPLGNPKMAGVYRVGVADALVRFKIAAPAPLPAPAAGPSFASKVKDFGAGQWGAAKDFAANVRGGMGGKANPNFITGAVPEHSMDMARASQRGAAVGNLKTLAPTLLAGGGLYMLHQHNQAEKEEEARQHAMMGGGMSMGGGY
jgi:hypothetical protein